jgi:hypothetical protein
MQMIDRALAAAPKASNAKVVFEQYGKNVDVTLTLIYPASTSDEDIDAETGARPSNFDV